jgi:hypothetical protein
MAVLANGARKYANLSTICLHCKHWSFLQTGLQLFPVGQAPERF